MADPWKEWFAEIEKVIVKHLGDGGEYANSNAADRLWRACSEAESNLAVFDGHSEIKKLEHIRHLLGEISIALDELHPKGGCPAQCRKLE